jgi:hypothetical protein
MAIIDTTVQAGVKPLEQFLPEFWWSMFQNLMKQGFSRHESWALLTKYVETVYRPVPSTMLSPALPMATNAWPNLKNPYVPQDGDTYPKVTCGGTQHPAEHLLPEKRY